jgi:hypothetical protein
VPVTAGVWQVSARAYNGEGRLRAIAEEVSITVIPGGTHTITMKACIGVKTGADLMAALDGSLYPPDAVHGDLIVLETDIALTPSMGGHIPITSGKYTLIAAPGTTRTLSKACISVETSTLTLGRTGETGKLILDGQNEDIEASYGIPAGLQINGSTLNIEGNTEITRYESSGTQGSAIFLTGGSVNGYSTLNMSGGDIHDNRNTGGSSGYGGAIFVDASTFNLSGGKVRDNRIPEGQGGAVYVVSSTYSPGQARFTMSGGEISGNIAGQYNQINGGGVYLDGSSAASAADVRFTMSGGLIDNNQCPQGDGGGVYVKGAEFIMSGGTISNNKATGRAGGGGVFVTSASVFQMSGGTISGNTADGTGANEAKGGGLYVDNGVVNLTGGFIEGNIAKNGSSSAGGGGIYASAGTFSLIGAAVRNNTAQHPSTANGGGLLIGNTDNLLTLGGGTTIANNKAEVTNSGASAQGGGIYTGGGIYNGCTVSGGLFLSGNDVRGSGTANSGGGLFDSTRASGSGQIDVSLITFSGGNMVNGSTGSGVPYDYN